MIKTHRQCQICGEPLAQGRSHDRCKPPGAKKSPEADLRIALDQLTREIQKTLSGRVKRWTKGDGEDRKRELFPDLA